MARQWTGRHKLAASVGGAAIAIVYGFLSIYPTGPSAIQQAAGTLVATSGGTITVTRASNKSCHNSSGAIVTLANDIPCVEAPGVLIEGASTNLFLTSGVPATQTFTLANGAQAASMDSGSGTIAYAVGTAVATGLPCTVNATTKCYFTVTTGGTVVATVTGTVVAPQLESQAWASSYIPTTGTAASRAADVITVPNPLAGATNKSFCIGYTAIPEPKAWGGNVVLISGGNNGSRNSWYLRNGGGQLQPFIYDAGGGFDYWNGATVDDASHRMVYCNVSGVSTEYLDGSLVSIVDSAQGGTSIISTQPASLALGSVSGGSQPNAWFKNICMGVNHSVCY